MRPLRSLRSSDALGGAELAGAEKPAGLGPPDAVNTGGPVPLIEMLARKGGFAGLRETTIRP